MNPEIKAGSAVYYLSNPGSVIEVTEKSVTIQMDHGRFQDERGPGKLVVVEPADFNYIELAELLPRDEAINSVPPGGTLIYSPHGYLISEDGTVHVLLQRWFHGIGVALLYPEQAKQWGYREPDVESSVYHYQQLELDHARALPLIRVAFGMLTARAVSCSPAPATAAQIAALREVFKVCSIKPRDEVMTDYRDMTSAQALEFIATDRTPQPAHGNLKVPDDF